MSDDSKEKTITLSDAMKIYRNNCHGRDYAEVFNGLMRGINRVNVSELSDKQVKDLMSFGLTAAAQILSNKEPPSPVYAAIGEKRRTLVDTMAEAAAVKATELKQSGKTTYEILWGMNEHAIVALEGLISNQDGPNASGAMA